VRFFVTHPKLTNGENYLDIKSGGSVSLQPPTCIPKGKVVRRAEIGIKGTRVKQIQVFWTKPQAYKRNTTRGILQDKQTLAL